MCPDMQSDIRVQFRADAAYRCAHAGFLLLSSVPVKERALVPSERNRRKNGPIKLLPNAVINLVRDWAKVER